MATNKMWSLKPGDCLFARGEITLALTKTIRLILIEEMQLLINDNTTGSYTTLQSIVCRFNDELDQYSKQWKVLC